MPTQRFLLLALATLLGSAKVGIQKWDSPEHVTLSSLQQSTTAYSFQIQIHISISFVSPTTTGTKRNIYQWDYWESNQLLCDHHQGFWSSNLPQLRNHLIRWLQWNGTWSHHYNKKGEEAIVRFINAYDWPSSIHLHESYSTTPFDGWADDTTPPGYKPSHLKLRLNGANWET